MGLNQFLNYSSVDPNPDCQLLNPLMDCAFVALDVRFSFNL